MPAKDVVMLRATAAVHELLPAQKDLGFREVAPVKQRPNHQTP